MTTPELRVKVKYPRARCIAGGRPKFQIWNLLFSFIGEKLGEGNTEKSAWKDALKKTTQERA